LERHCLYCSTALDQCSISFGEEKREKVIFESIYLEMGAHEEMIPPHFLEGPLLQFRYLTWDKTVHHGGDFVVARAVVSDGVIEPLMVFYLGADKARSIRWCLVADINVKCGAISCVAVITTTWGVFEVDGDDAINPTRWRRRDQSDRRSCRARLLSRAPDRR
jgi:hypothetical protein